MYQIRRAVTEFGHRCTDRKKSRIALAVRAYSDAPMKYILALALCLTACGGASTTVTAPTPIPTPAPAPQPAPAPRITITATLIDTVSLAVIGSFAQDVASLPASVTVSAPGHLTRVTRVGSSTPTIDLIPTTAPFSSIFYNQLARGTLEDPIQPLYVLAQAPSFYLQTAGLSGGNVDRLRTAAREIVPAMTGGRFTVTTFETGPESRPPQAGWIVIDLVNEPDSGHCGRALVGAASGHIWLNTASTPTTTCGLKNGDTVERPSIQHEIGHALGFWHIDVRGALMNGALRWDAGTSLTDGEKYHAAIAYHRQPGNRDPDSDAVTSTPLAVRSGMLVID